MSWKARSKEKDEERRRKREDALSRIKRASEDTVEERLEARAIADANKRCSRIRAAKRMQARANAMHNIENVDEIPLPELRPIDLHRVYSDAVAEHLGSEYVQESASLKQLGSWKSLLRHLEANQWKINPVRYVRGTVAIWKRVRADIFKYRDIKSPSVELLAKHDNIVEFMVRVDEVDKREREIAERLKASDARESEVNSEPEAPTLNDLPEGFDIQEWKQRQAYGDLFEPLKLTGGLETFEITSEDIEQARLYLMMNNGLV